MDTPPYSDVSAQLSPGGHPIHVNGDIPPNAVGLPNGAPAPGPGPASGSGIGSVDVRSLHSTSWSALDTPPPPTLREILTAYKQKGDGDRDMLLAMLNAKSAEDQRIASQLSLRRTMLEINKYTVESRSPSQSHIQYHGHAQHMYTYVPDEPYALAGTNHHHAHVAPVSPPTLPHTYAARYPSSHGQAPRNHAHVRVVESPPLSSVTQKSALSGTRTRPASLHSHLKASTRLGDARSQIHAVPQSHSQPLIPGQSQRRKRARHSRSRSRSPDPVGSTSSPHRTYAYTYVRSPPYAHSAEHSRTRSELDPERSPYSSASDSGSPRGRSSAHVQGQNYPRTMAIGSLLSAGAKAGVNTVSNAAGPSSARPNGTSSNGVTNGSAVPGRVKEERSERDQDVEAEDEHEEAWARERESGRRGSRDGR